MRITTATAAAAAALAISIASTAFAQDSSSSDAAIADFPEACAQAGAGAGEQNASHGQMDMSAMQDHQRANMEGMMEPDRNMRTGMMADDPDIAFACGMIAHHQGAIVMAETELKYGDDEAMKALAEEIIAAQKQEIAEMTAWIEENAK